LRSEKEDKSYYNARIKKECSTFSHPVSNQSEGATIRAKGNSLSRLLNECPSGKPLSGRALAPVRLFQKEEARKSKDYITTFLFLFAKKKLFR
jgi:hypothetical protein